MAQIVYRVSVPDVGPDGRTRRVTRRFRAHGRRRPDGLDDFLGQYPKDSARIVYDVRVRINGREESHTCPTRQKADEVAATEEAKKVAGTAIDSRSGRVTFETYAKRWLAQHTDLRPTTRELYGLLLEKWLKPELGDLPIGRMTPDLWRGWHATATRKHPGSLQPGKAYKLGRAILNTAVEDRLITSNPCRVRHAAVEDSPERPVATVEQVYAIADAIEPRYRALVLLATFCCLRFGEAAGLSRGRIDLKTGTVTIEEQAIELAGGKVIFGPPKTNAGRRRVPVPAPLLAELKTHLRTYVGTGADALVFTSPQGHPLRRTKFRGFWLTACRKAGVSDLKFHDLRHSGATMAGHEGATLRELMDLLGHTTPTVALRYQHSTEDRKRALANSIGKRILADRSKSTRDKRGMSRA